MAPAEELLDELAALERLLAQVTGGPEEHAAAARAFFLGRHGPDEGERRFHAATRILAYLRANQEELRRLGLLLRDRQRGWRIDPRLVATLAESLEE